MQNTYRLSKTAPILIYLPRLIKLVRADFERPANVPKHPVINYPPLYRLLHKTPKNRISVLPCPISRVSSESRLHFRLQQPSQSTHDIFLNHFYGLLGPQNVKIHENLNIDFFHDSTFPIGKVKVSWAL